MQKCDGVLPELSLICKTPRHLENRAPMTSDKFERNLHRQYRTGGIGSRASLIQVVQSLGNCLTVGAVKRLHSHINLS
jgi:hypothetical protein